MKSIFKIKRNGIVNIKNVKVFVAVIVLLFLLLLLFKHSNKKITMSFVGDILLDRGVLKQMELNGYEYPFLEVKQTLRKADICCGNLECPLTDGGIPSSKDPKYIFKAPVDMAKYLKDAGFTLLNLANNHTMDHGAKGLLDTIDILDKYGIACVGGGTTLNDATLPLFISVRGTKIGFLSYSAFPPEGYFYADEKPNISKLNISTLGASVCNAKEQCDFLVVCFHWGREFDFFPNEDQKIAAHIAVDNGADIVIGHHPHVYQGIEEYNGKYIFYSLGNFVFDKQIPPGTDESYILNIYLRKGELEKIDLIPVKINYCQPKVIEKKGTGEREQGTVLLLPHK